MKKEAGNVMQAFLEGTIKNMVRASKAAHTRKERAKAVVTQSEVDQLESDLAKDEAELQRRFAALAAKVAKAMPESLTTEAANLVEVQAVVDAKRRTLSAKKAHLTRQTQGRRKQA